MNEDNYSPEQLEPTTTCDDCGKTGPINSTNWNPTTDQILCPACDSKE